ncbi:cytochrome P450 [Zopfochytrium polystomum]|nr:cytochrome P450 [Zopfochytrium polystomum]
MAAASASLASASSPFSSSSSPLLLLAAHRKFPPLSLAAAAAAAAIVLLSAKRIRHFILDLITNSPFPSAGSVAGSSSSFSLSDSSAITSVPTVPSWIPFLGSALAFNKDPVGFLRRCRDRYGPVFRLHIAGKNMVFVVDQALFGAVLRTPALTFQPIKDAMVKSVMGAPDAYFASLPADRAAYEHTVYVKYLLNGQGGLDNLLPAAVAELSRLIDALPTDQPLPLYSTLSKLIFVAGTRTLFGDAVDADAVYADFLEFDAGFPLLVAGAPAWLVTRSTAARTRLRARLTAAARDPAFSAPAAAGGASDVVKALAARFHEVLRRTTDADGTDADPDASNQGGGLLLGFLWAANANSIPTAFWTAHGLLRSPPAALAAVRAEIAQNLPAGTPWTRDALSACVLLDSAVDEALRLAATPMIVRTATDDCTLPVPVPSAHGPAQTRHLRIARGEELFLYSGVTHRDPAVFAPRPDEFVYDRFVGAPAALRNALVPFGGGKSMCPGRLLAKAQMKMAVALLLARADPVLVGAGDAAPVPEFDRSRTGVGIYPPASDAVQFVLRPRKEGAT